MARKKTPDKPKDPEVVSPHTPVFTAEAHKEYDACKREIRTTVEQIIRFGGALHIVQSKQYYLIDGYENFTEFAEKEVGISQSRASRYINGYKVILELQEADPKYLPKSMAQVEELLKLRNEPERLKEVWKETSDLVPEGKVTGGLLKELLGSLNERFVPVKEQLLKVLERRERQKSQERPVRRRSLTSRIKGIFRGGEPEKHDRDLESLRTQIGNPIYYTVQELTVLKSFSDIFNEMIIKDDGFAVMNGADRSIFGFYTPSEIRSHPPFGIKDIKQFITFLEPGDCVAEVKNGEVLIHYTNPDLPTTHIPDGQDTIRAVPDLEEAFTARDPVFEFNITGEAFEKLLSDNKRDRRARLYLEGKRGKVILTRANDWKGKRTGATEEIDWDRNLPDNLKNQAVYVLLQDLKFLEYDYRVTLVLNEDGLGACRWQNREAGLDYYVGVYSRQRD